MKFLANFYFDDLHQYESGQNSEITSFHDIRNCSQKDRNYE